MGESGSRTTLERIALALMFLGLAGAAWIGRASVLVGLYVASLVTLAATLFAMTATRPRYRRIRVAFLASAALFVLFVAATAVQLGNLVADYPGWQPAVHASFLLGGILLSFGLLLAGAGIRVYGANLPRLKRVLFLSGSVALGALGLALAGILVGALDMTYFVATSASSSGVVLSVVSAAYACNVAFFIGFLRTSMPYRVAILGPGGTGKTHILGVLDGEDAERARLESRGAESSRRGHAHDRRRGNEFLGTTIPGQRYYLWGQLIEEVPLDGLIYVLDHRPMPKDLKGHVAKAQFLVDEILRNAARQPRLKKILVLYNKKDEWEHKVDVDEVAQPYQPQWRRLAGAGLTVIERASCSKGADNEVDVVGIVSNYLDQL